MMEETLCYIGRKLNDHHIRWAVGASVMLHQLGLIEHPQDVDIHVATEDIDKADEIFQSIGQKQPKKKTKQYSTQFFYQYKVNGVDIDVMAGLAINCADGIFQHVFDQQSISQVISKRGVKIPFAALEDWFVLYLLLPKREVKVEMIENYLQLYGLQHPFLLERALRGYIPKEARERVIRLLGRDKV